MFYSLEILYEVLDVKSHAATGEVKWRMKFRSLQQAMLYLTIPKLA